MNFLERHELAETCEIKLADYGVETMRELKSLSLDLLKSDVKLKPMHAKRVIDALAADGKGQAAAAADAARAEADAAAAAAKAKADAEARARAQEAKEKQEKEAERQREADAEAARQREADATAAAAAAAAAEPQLSPAEQEQADANEKVYKFGRDGDVEKLTQALKDGGKPEGHKVRE